ncbi:MAG: DUF4258 domain-containing protein [Dehalococcoidia bacterium]|nr:DUF4258 domain-containing protein [Dehalococcoidia bacterium]
MNLYFSRHARNRMRRFGVSPGEVEQLLEGPDHTESGEKGRRNAWRKRNDRYIRVTYVEEQERTVVVTVTLKDRLPKGGIA